MIMIQEAISRLKSYQEGATAVEYAIMVALIAAVIIAAVVIIGQEANSTFNCVGNSLKTSTGKC